jgi:hypothetical protein
LDDPFLDESQLVFFPPPDEQVRLGVLGLIVLLVLLVALSVQVLLLVLAALHYPTWL